MMRILGVALLAAVLVGQAAAEVAIVVPGEYEDTEAPGGVRASTTGFPNGYRLQFVYDSSEFAALPPSHTIMTGFFMRPDGRLGNANSVSWPNFTVKLSTTAVEPGSQSLEFNANIGPDETVVYDGPITFTTANIGPVGGPKEFDIAFEFETPFQYDPADGNLLIDWIVEGPAGWVGDDRGAGSSLSSWISSNNWNTLSATDAGANDGIISFRFVPEPSSVALTVIGLAGLLGWRGKKG